jgi:hypothetical protein
MVAGGFDAVGHANFFMDGRVVMYYVLCIE